MRINYKTCAVLQRMFLKAFYQANPAQQLSAILSGMHNDVLLALLRHLKRKKPKSHNNFSA